MENENLEVIDASSINDQNKNVEESPLEIVKKMINLSDKGCQITGENVALNILFKNINTNLKNELVPAIEKITDFDNLNDELKNAGDILVQIINWSDRVVSKSGKLTGFACGVDRKEQLLKLEANRCFQDNL